MVEDLAEDPSLAELMIRDLKLEPVDEVDNVRLLARAYRNMRHYENLLYQYRAGMLDEDEWQGFRENLKALMAWRAMREYWANEGHYYSTRFREEIAGIEREREKSGDLPEYQYVIREAGPRDSDQ